MIGLRADPRDYFRCFLSDLTGSVTPSRPLPVTGNGRFHHSTGEGIKTYTGHIFTRSSALSSRGAPEKIGDFSPGRPEHDEHGKAQCRYPIN